MSNFDLREFMSTQDNLIIVLFACAINNKGKKKSFVRNDLQRQYMTLKNIHICKKQATCAYKPQNIMEL